mgnify:CR=1 FL=1
MANLAYLYLKDPEDQAHRIEASTPSLIFNHKEATDQTLKVEDRFQYKQVMINMSRPTKTRTMLVYSLRISFNREATLDIDRLHSKSILNLPGLAAAREG